MQSSISSRHSKAPRPSRHLRASVWMLCGITILAIVLIQALDGPAALGSGRAVALALLNCVGAGGFLRGYLRLTKAKSYSSGLAALPIAVLYGPLALGMAVMTFLDLLSNDETKDEILPLVEQISFAAVYLLPTPVAMASLLWGWALPDKHRRRKHLRWSLTHYPTPPLPPAGHLR